MSDGCAVAVKNLVRGRSYDFRIRRRGARGEIETVETGTYVESRVIADATFIALRRDTGRLHLLTTISVSAVTEHVCLASHSL